MKQYYLFILFLILTWGCATKRPAYQSALPTVNSDLYPAEITRDQYYEEMARSFSADGQVQKAIDYYRIAILHNPNRLSAHLALSDEYRKAQMDHLASFELSEVLSKEPSNKEALLKMGDLYLSTQMYAKAKEAFANVLKIDDQYEEARWSLYFICLLEKNYIEAEKAISNILQTEENRFQLTYQKAMLEKHFLRFENYSRLISEAFALNPHNKKILLEMQNHYLKLFDFESAQNILKNYSETHDFDLEISENLVFVTIRTENYDLAIKELDKQRKWTRNTALIDMKKAHIYFLASDLPQAEILYKSALAKNSQLDEARFYLAQIYLYENRLNETQTLLSELKPSSEYYPEAQVRLAFLEKESGKADLALNRIRTAHNQRPDQLIVYKAYADFLIENKRYVETIALLEKGIGYFPNDEDLRVKAAFVHYRLKNQKSFRKNIAKALEINPSSSEIYSYLTELWFLKKKDPKQIEYFANKALEFKTKNTNIKPLLAWSLLAQDRSTEAVALFEKFYEENPNQPYYAEALAKVYRRADVVIKGQQMQNLALKLQINNRLKSGLILDSNNKTIESNQPNSSPVRLPASLENR